MIYSFFLLYYSYSGYEFSEQNFKISYFLNGLENLMLSSDLLPFKFNTVNNSRLVLSQAWIFFFWTSVIGMDCVLIFFLNQCHRHGLRIDFFFFYHKFLPLKMILFEAPPNIKHRHLSTKILTLVCHIMRD